VQQNPSDLSTKTVKDTEQVEQTPEQARIAQLEAAIRTHRFDVGRGYHYHSFRSVTDANMRLWSIVTDRSIYTQDTPDTPSLAAEAPLARPAMMEDTE
jgi:hypothetical protein